MSLSALQARFDEPITSKEQLRQFVRPPNHRVANKVVDRLDDHCRRFLALSPFAVVASSSASGVFDLSPKGDPPGFALVLDDKTLALPDRMGNNRLDTFCNLLENPRVGLIFLIPGENTTLRISGAACIVRDQALRERMVHRGNAPELALVVEVARVMFHCPKCMVRASMWKPEGWPDLAAVPSMAEAMVDHGKLQESVQDIQAIIDNDGRTRLY